MKVKVKDTVYDGDQEPIMIILTSRDKQNISNMLPEAAKYACFPDEIPTTEIERWMNDVPEVPDEC